MPDLHNFVAAAVAVLVPVAAAADDSAMAGSASANPAGAPVRISICYNYGCYTRADVDFSAVQLGLLDHLFAGVRDAGAERRALARAIGRMYYFAGGSTPIWRDHGLNFRDGGVEGKMDCIDHAHNTNEFLLLLKARGLLHFHDVHDRLKRTTLLVADHWTARIAETASGAEYAVDSWYFDPGEPAAVMPVEDWLRRKDPRG